MPARRIRAIGGLSTDPTAIGNPEALREAANVLLHRPGIIQPRFGIGDSENIEPRTTDHRVIAIVPFDGDLVIQSTDNITYRLELASEDSQFDGSVEPPDLAVSGVSSFCEARGSLYVTTADGVKKLTSADYDTVQALLPAGLVTDYVVPSFGVGLTATDDHYVLGGDNHVAYRYVWKTTDANGYVRRSAPSPRFSASNNDTNKYYVPFGRIYLPEGMVEGDELEIYRTVNASPYTTDPGDEMFLAVTYTITASDQGNGYITGGLGAGNRTSIIDKTPDALLGQALYTNVSQGGLLSANERPPLANHLALWSRCMWYAGTSERRTMLVEPRCVYDSNTSYADTWRDGIHYSDNRTATLATNTALTAVSRIDGAKVGQYVTSVNRLPSDASTNFSALTKITAITTTITIVDNANITTGGSPDTLTFTGVPGAAGDDWTTIIWHATTTSFGQAAKGANAAASATNLASAINTTMDGRRAKMTAVANSNTVTITDDDGHGVPVTITETVGGTETVAYAMTTNKATLTTGAGVSISLHDYITVDGIEFFFSALGPSLDDPTGAVAAFATPISKRIIETDNARGGGEDLTDQCKALVRNISETINAYGIYQNGISIRSIADRVLSDTTTFGWYTPDTSASPSSLLLIRTDPGLGAISASHSPSRPPGGIRFEQDFGAERRPGRLWYSKPDEPEAVPPSNWIDVGNVNEAIIATTPLRNALLVWKVDGLFRITGSAPTSWVVDEIDLTLRLLSSQCVCLTNGIAYALTDRGVVAATEVGTEVISGDIATELRGIQRLLPRNDPDHKRAFWMVAHELKRLIIMGVGSDSGDDWTEREYVYALDTGRWSTFERGDRCMAYDPVGERVIVSTSHTSWNLFGEWTDTADGPTLYVDEFLSNMNATIDGVTVTIALADFGGLVPHEGDVIEDTLSSTARTIAAVDIDGSDYVITVDAAGLGGTAVNWFRHFLVSVTWQGEQAPGIGVRWQEMHAHFGGFLSDLIEDVPINLGGQTEAATSPSYVTPEVPTSGAGQASVVRVGVPRAITRSTRFYPHFSTNVCAQLWSLEAIDLYHTLQSQRVAR